MQCTKCGAEVQPGATVCPVCEERVVLTRKSVAVPRNRAAAPAPSPAATAGAGPVGTAVPAKAAAASKPRLSMRMITTKQIMIAVAAIVLVVAGWLGYTLLASGPNTPDAAALRFMQAYAGYDARGMLDNSTHASFTTTDQATFEREMARAATEQQGQPLYKDIKVTSVNIAPEDPNSAVVRLSAQMLGGASTGTTATAAATATPAYSPRDEVLTVVKPAGKWLVKWN